MSSPATHDSTIKASKKWEPSFEFQFPQDLNAMAARTLWKEWSKENAEKYIGEARKRKAESLHISANEIARGPNEEHAFLHLSAMGYESQKLSKVGSGLTTRAAGVAAEIVELAAPAWNHKWNQAFKEESNADLFNNVSGADIACALAKEKQKEKLSDTDKQEFLNRVADKIVDASVATNFKQVFVDRKAPEMFILESTNVLLEKTHDSLSSAKQAFSAFVKDLKKKVIVRRVDLPNTF
jgi:predicted GIY-YIG superfamily endonuclease